MLLLCLAHLASAMFVYTQQPGTCVSLHALCYNGNSDQAESVIQFLCTKVAAAKKLSKITLKDN